VTFNNGMKILNSVIKLSSRSEAFITLPQIIHSSRTNELPKRKQIVIQTEIINTL